MKKFIPLLISGILVISAVGCAEKAAETGSEEPNATNEALESSGREVSGVEDSNQPEVETAPTDQTDANSTENPQESDLSTKVSDKLAENLPNNNLEIKEQEGVVTIGGTVDSQEELQQIEPLAKGVEGVKSVKVEANVGDNTPADDSSPE